MYTLMNKGEVRLICDYGNIYMILCFVCIYLVVSISNMVYMFNAETVDCLEPFATKLPFIGFLGKSLLPMIRPPSPPIPLSYHLKLYETDNFHRDSYTLI